MSKKILIGCFGLILVLLGLTYYFWYLVSEGLKTDCNLIETISIEDYEIQRNKCSGVVGPSFTKLVLYKNGKKVSDGFIKKDSCKVSFQENKEKIGNISLSV